MPDDKPDKTPPKMIELMGVMRDYVLASSKLTKTTEKTGKAETREILKKESNVAVTELSPKASGSLIDAYIQKAGKDQDKKTEDVKDSVKEGKGFFANLLGPGMLAIMGGLVGLIGSLSRLDLVDAFKEGGIKGVLKEIADNIWTVLGPIIKMIPVVGPIYSLWDAYVQFKKGSVTGIIDGVKSLLQAIVGFAPGGALIIGGLEVGASLLVSFLESKGVDMDKNRIGGTGGTALMTIMKAMKPFFKMGVLKRIPVIGSLISFYEAYQSFKGGGFVGVVDGLMAIVSGVATLVPGLGTALGLGIDVIRMMLFKKTESGKMESRGGGGSAVAKILMNAFFWLAKSPILRKMYLLGSLINFYDAYQGFKSGSIAGISDGLLALVSGVAGLFPVVGTGISIGIDVLRAFMFSKKEDPKTGKTVIEPRSWFNKLTTFISESFPIKNFFDLYTGITMMFDGQWGEGLAVAAYALPFFGSLVGYFGGPKTSEDAVEDMSGPTSFMRLFGEALLKSFPFYNIKMLYDGVVDLFDGKFVQGFNKMAFSLPFMTTVAKFMGVSQPDGDTPPRVRPGGILGRMTDYAINSLRKRWNTMGSWTRKALELVLPDHLLELITNKKPPVLNEPAGQYSTDQRTIPRRSPKRVRQTGFGGGNTPEQFVARDVMHSSVPFGNGEDMKNYLLSSTLPSRIAGVSQKYGHAVQAAKAHPALAASGWELELDQARLEAFKELKDQPGVSSSNLDARIKAAKAANRGHRALGGDVEAGGQYTVGETGPEMFVPREDGTILPNMDKLFKNSIKQPLYDVGEAIVKELQTGGIVAAIRELRQDINMILNNKGQGGTLPAQQSQGVNTGHNGITQQRNIVRMA